MVWSDWQLYICEEDAEGFSNGLFNFISLLVYGRISFTWWSEEDFNTQSEDGNKETALLFDRRERKTKERWEEDAPNEGGR